MAEESIEDIYAAIGQAVSIWARLEKSLFRFFYTLQGGSLYENAAIFFAWHGFEQKLNLVDEIMRIRFKDKDELKFWTILKKYIFALGKERNFIVHNEVRIYTRFKDKGPNQDDLETLVSFAQENSPFEVQLRGKQPRQLKLSDIQRIEHAIAVLDIYLDGFREALKGEPDALPDKYRGSWSEPFLESFLSPR